MTAALLGLALIVLIAVAAVTLGALTRLLAVRLATPRAQRRAAEQDLSLAERIVLGNSYITRELRPDGTHPVARTAPKTGVDVAGPGREPRQDLAVRFPDIAAHMLR
ncbi:hypothetical protein [Brachybacterium saurashtrense]|uniref:Uncharacterized protein n=1 Tax=Brachybacterium saurashtrense TaxID=556288 RepID=A0ABM6XCV2_9MICO|nr:hypothetical protein [Brachybacterium saurashtrense]AXK46487.1 hypothetical protein DWV08_13270 [Brachybacterium saurashtrense]